MSRRPVRRALCVGINYVGTPNELAGCVNDARAWREYLESKRFAVTSLTNAEATRAGILSLLQQLLEQSQPGDVVCFVFSGHGTSLRDLDGDEPDGRDEAMCPVDFDRGRYLIDDDLRALFALHLKDGVGCTVIADCCHSGTIARLLADPVRRPSAGARPRYIRATDSMEKRHWIDRAEREGGVAPREVLGTPLRWITLSACHASEVAYESNGQGHFTGHALSVLRVAGATLTRAGFMRRLLAAFGEDRAQTPQLDAPDGAEKRTLYSTRIA